MATTEKGHGNAVLIYWSSSSLFKTAKRLIRVIKSTAIQNNYKSTWNKKQQHL